jgi:hypothetical protein
MKRRWEFIALLALLTAVCAALAAACGSSSSSSSASSADDDASPSDDDVSPADDDDDSSPAAPVTPHREDRGKYAVVWLAGTPYEMGHQHGVMLHDELAAGIDWLNSMDLVQILVPIARALGLLQMAEDNTYTDIVQECQGLVDAAGDVGWTMDVCLLLNFGDVLIEFLTDGIPPATDVPLEPACTQAVATGAATKDGRLYHMRSLDWGNIPYLLDYPVIFVRQPSDGIPHVYIGFPGNLSPYNGINAAGLSIASNQAEPHDQSQHSRTGRSNVQMLGQLLKLAHNIDEAQQMIETTPHMACINIVVADGNAREAAAFEITSKQLGIRELTDDTVWETNHFVASNMQNADKQPRDPSSLLRYDRVSQLVPRDGKDSIFGKIDPAAFVGVLRDRVNPYNDTVSPPVFDNGGMSIATNAAIYQIVFDPEALNFWVAAGGVPVPSQPFEGFSLSELLDWPNSTPVVPGVIQ